MQLTGMNEYGTLKKVAVRTPELSFVSSDKIEAEWEALRFYSAPELEAACSEHANFIEILKGCGADIVELKDADTLTLDAIYARDALLVSPNGLILCNMGRAGRRGEPVVNAAQLVELGANIAGGITAAGTIEGGDVIWLSDTALAIGLGPRTNAEGINQLGDILGAGVEIFIVPLPAPSHPDDVFHLMSMISPLDHNLALIYRPLMPAKFIEWLEVQGISFVEVPDSEFVPMGCNVLALGPRQVLMLDRLPETKARLEAAGCSVQTYAGDEISRKGEGGPTCLTRPLIRA